MSYDAKSLEQWKKVWQKALKSGSCPLEGCSLENSTCEHLDLYLTLIEDSKRRVAVERKQGQKPRRRVLDREPSLFFTPYIEDFQNVYKAEEEEPLRTWEKFKILRRYPLTNDQIHILILKYVYRMTNQEILEHAGWTSHRTLHRRHQQALAILKKGMK